MGAQQSKPFNDLSKEEISFAMADIGECYKVYCPAVVAHGVDGSLLDSIDDSELQQALDNLDITSRLHRRVLLRELNKAKSSKDFVSAAYDYGPSTPASNLVQYAQIAETCFKENTTTAVLAGVHLILNNGNQLSLETKMLMNGQMHSKRLSVCRRLSICSNVVNDGTDFEYYKLDVPALFRRKVFEDLSSMTYTGYILKNGSGKRVGVVCLVDGCSPSEVVDSERKTFLRRMAQETEHQLEVRKQLVDKERRLQSQIRWCQSDIARSADNRKEIVSLNPGDIQPTVVQQVSGRLEQGVRLNNPSTQNSRQEPEKCEMRATHKLPIFQENIASEEERAHLPEDFYARVDMLSAPRPPINKHDMERSAAVQALGMADICPEDEIALHLKSMVRMARQVFGFPHAEITFQNHECHYCMAGDSESEAIIATQNKFFQPIKYNSDGSRFLSKMPRGAAQCNYVTASGGTVVVQDLAADETFCWLANASPLRCYVGSPIKDSSGNVVAVLCLVDTKARPDFEAAHEIEIEQLASLISQSFENWVLTRSIKQLAQERHALAQIRNKVGIPKGNVAFVLTEIQGSTILSQSDPVALKQSRIIYDDIMRKLCVAHWGYKIETEGDDISSAWGFHDQVDAFAFALRAQTALFEVTWPEALLAHPEAKEESGAFRGVRVRMAVHHGTVESIESDNEPNRVDFNGESLSLTKSLLSMAQGGQILTTAETWEVAYYFMHSVLGYPQVLDHGCHVMQMGSTPRDGVITKRIIQLVPSNLAYDYFAARKLVSSSLGEKRNNCKLNGRQFPRLTSLKAVTASFHDAPFKGNEATIAFVNLADIDEQEVSYVTTLIGKMLDGLPQFGGYQCQNEMMVFHRPVDAVLFGLHLRNELGRKVGGANLVQRIKFGCVHDTFLTMGPHRSTGRADYFGKIVNRAARLSSAAAPGSVCFGVFASNADKTDFFPDPKIKVNYLGTKALKGIREEISVYECTLSSAASVNDLGLEHSLAKEDVRRTAFTCAVQDFWRASFRREPQTRHNL